MCSATFVEWATLMGDVLIAAVIFYEVEEHRASTFLADLQGAEFYKDRARCRAERRRFRAPVRRRS
jgi:hypothetical protein